MATLYDYFLTQREIEDLEKRLCLLETDLNYHIEKVKSRRKIISITRHLLQEKRKKLKELRRKKNERSH